MRSDHIPKGSVETSLKWLIHKLIVIQSGSFMLMILGWDVYSTLGNGVCAGWSILVVGY